MADAIGVTSAQPYQGRHAAPDADADDASLGRAEPAMAGKASQVATVTRPSLPPHLATVLAHQDAGEPPEPDPDDWIHYTPPQDLALKHTMWELPAGFVPMKPPPARSLWKTLGWVVVVAVVGGLGWFGYRVSTQPKPKLHTLDTPAATVTYTSAAGHFTVRLPERPITGTFTKSLGRYTVRAWAALDSAHSEGVVGLVVTPSIPPARMADFMHGALAGIARNAQVSDVQTSTYRGHPAITATKTASDGTVREMFFAQSPTRMYLLVASDDAALRALEARFRPTR